MDTQGQLQAEFETLGEAVVAERLGSNHYQGSARALAMRWLNEKSLIRIGIDAPAHGITFDPSTRRMMRAEHTARVAVLFAVVALLAAVGSLGLSVKTLQALQTLRQSVASSSSSASASASAPSSAPAPTKPSS
jgi:hypothetical protein